MLEPLPFRDRLRLRIQRQTSYLFFPLVAAVTLFVLKGVWRLSLRDAAAVRARFRALVPDVRPPILLCSNHLTLVDSMILAWALAPARDYLLRFSTFPWSVPEKSNFSGTFFWNVTSFLGKSVYVTRGGPRDEVRRTLARIAHLLRAGELVSVFPEGGRSRKGRVDTEDFAYGVGQVLQAVPEARVLCVYLRGRKQDDFTDFPHRGDEYHVDLELFQPTTHEPRLRGARDLATQVVHKLADMERLHLDARE